MNYNIKRRKSQDCQGCSFVQKSQRNRLTVARWLEKSMQMSWLPNGSASPAPSWCLLTVATKFYSFEKKCQVFQFFGKKAAACTLKP
jgi:hypothetical protein